MLDFKCRLEILDVGLVSTQPTITKFIEQPDKIKNEAHSMR